MKSLLYASVAGAALLLTGSASAEIPTGYKVKGCPQYKLDHNYRVVQLCKETAQMFWDRIQSNSENNSGPGDGAGAGAGGGDGDSGNE